MLEALLTVVLASCGVLNLIIAVGLARMFGPQFVLDVVRARLNPLRGATWKNIASLVALVAGCLCLAVTGLEALGFRNAWWLGGFGGYFSLITLLALCIVRDARLGWWKRVKHQTADRAFDLAFRKGFKGRERLRLVGYACIELAVLLAPFAVAACGINSILTGRPDMPDWLTRPDWPVQALQPLAERLLSSGGPRAWEAIFLWPVWLVFMLACLPRLILWPRADGKRPWPKARLALLTLTLAAAALTLAGIVRQIFW
jgi:hypothetical protein